MSEIFGDGQDERGAVQLLEPAVPRAVFEDGSVEEPRETGKLQAGSHARIYRDGQVLEGIVQVPVKGNLSLRHLAPGTYVLRDESGNQAAVRVGALAEDAVVQVAGGAPDFTETGTAEPGSAVVQTIEQERNTRPASSEQQPGFPNVGPDESWASQGDMIRPSQPRAKKISPEEAERDDVIAPAEPGSALITPEEGVTQEPEIPDDAQKGVVTEPTEQDGDPELEHLAITPQEERIAAQQKSEQQGGAVDPDNESKESLRAQAKQAGVSQRGTKAELAARINAHRAP